jgi:hypothetical protein
MSASHKDVTPNTRPVERATNPYGGTVEWSEIEVIPASEKQFDVDDQ